MKTRVILIILALLTIWAVWDRDHVPQQDESAEPVAAPELRTLDPLDVIAYRKMTSPTIRVRTAQDVLPGGYAAAMAPAMIDWEHTDVSPGAWVVVRNIDAGGNPFSGVTVMRTVRLRTDLVKSAQFILVPLGGPKAVSHGQLRFEFEEGGLEFIGDVPDAVGASDSPNDLVFSWEAWWPPGVGYSVREGMDHQNYELSMRAFSGVQRFLEDSLGQRQWESYSLQLPGGQAGLEELLRVCLVLGDGAARHSIGKMLQNADEQWAGEGPIADRHGGDAKAEWEVVWKQATPAPSQPADPRLDMAGKTGYQSLLRSCATMALYCIDVAVARLIEAGVPSQGMRPTEKPELRDEPQWMAQLASTNLAGLFVRGPKAVEFVLANPQTIPSEIPGALDKAGLLVREGDKPQIRVYSMDTRMTPWGSMDELLLK